MNIKLYRSSTVGLNLKGFKILMDPWLTDGEYYGAWSHYPFFDLKNNLNEINNYDAIYISHIHPDHCSDETLKLINKKIPVYIHSYHSKFLKFKIQKLGFEVKELENNKRTQLNKNAYINIIAADNCDPELCYKFIGCADLKSQGPHSQQIDTIALIDDGQKVLMNVNDCPLELAKSTFGIIKKQYQKIDVLLTGYGGAGPYPQCFDNLSLNEKKYASQIKSKQFLNQAINYINEIQPNYYMPFAGTYTLTGSLSSLQSLRGVPSIDEAYEFLENHFSSKKLSHKFKPIKINPESSFDINLGQSDREYKKIDQEEYQSYIDSNLKKRLLQYENDETPTFDEIIDLSKVAYQRYTDKRLINNINLKSDIFIKVNGKALMLDVKNNFSVIDSDDIENKSDKYVSITTDIRLLKRLLLGPKFAHWNNAHIGSHVRFFRKPNLHERNLYNSMSFFHS